MKKKKEGSVLGSLSERDRMFVEGIVSGMSAIEAAKYAGSKARTKAGLAAHASRWKKRPKIQAAIAELREVHAIDLDELWTLTLRAMRELLQDRANPASRARVCELIAKLLGKLQPERHEHVHTHFEVPEPDTPEGRAELVRLVRIVLDSLEGEERAALVREALGENA